MRSPIRVPYGGLVTIQPVPSSCGKRDSVPRTNSTSPATPARSAFSIDAVIAPASRSVPTRGTVTPASSCAAARARAAGHVTSGIPGHASAANRRARPGAIRRAINAASMMIVPDPHIGSSNGSVGVHPEASSNVAASVSRIGALATACRQPRRCSSPPAASAERVTTSRCTRTTMRSTGGSADTSSSSASAVDGARTVVSPDTAAKRLRSSRSAMPSSW